MNRGQDGAILNFMQDISDVARASNGFVLEIGPGIGTGSTVAIQEGLAGHANPLHISVDHRDYMEWKPEVPWWHLVIGDSRSRMTLLEVASISDPRIPGLIFIDTDHNYDQMHAELPIWMPMAGDETVWLFHDTHMFGAPNDSMVRAIKAWECYGWVYDDWRPETHGLGRMRKCAV
jgi:cephalosporin hydroxylase